MISIRKVVVGFLRTNCYLVYNDKDEVIIIDPADSSNEISKYIVNKKVKAILLTHAHFDHIGALETLMNKYKCDVYCHIKDKIMMENEKANGSIPYGRTPVVVKNGITYFSSSIEIENFDIKVILTPGHTKGSVSYLFNDSYLFSGDFLFNGTVGRCDLYNASVSLMEESCRMIKKYRDDIIVYPGHGRDSTLGEEKINNPYLI